METIFADSVCTQVVCYDRGDLWLCRCSRWTAPLWLEVLALSLPPSHFTLNASWGAEKTGNNPSNNPTPMRSSAKWQYSNVTYMISQIVNKQNELQRHRKECLSVSKCAVYTGNIFCSSSLPEETWDTDVFWEKGKCKNDCYSNSIKIFASHLHSSFETLMSSA